MELLNNIKKEKYPYLLMVLIGVNCANNNTNTDCTITGDKVFEGNKNKLFIVDSLTIRDKGLDSIKGGEYTLYKNNNLKSYKFFGSLNAYTYNEEYAENGNLIKVEGHPLVLKKIREVNADSAVFGFYFFALNKLYTNIVASTSNCLKFKPLPISDSLYSNMIFVAFSMSTKNLSKFTIYIQTDYHNFCNAKRELFTDTINLIKNPILNISSPR